MADYSDVQLVIFDLDGTLAESKSVMTAETASLLSSLLALKKVAVISGGTFSQYETQFLPALTSSPELLQNLYLLPTSGTQLYTWNNGWKQIYSQPFSAEEKQKITAALKRVADELGFYRNDLDQIEDRDSQITFSALGQHAPLGEKAIWDIDHTKRTMMAKELRRLLPNAEITIGGTTSIDITHRNVNKAYGIRHILDMLHLQPHSALFIGDALYPGGNDNPARETHVLCMQVAGPAETNTVIEDIVSP